MEWYSNCGSEVRLSGKEKVFNVWGTVLVVHVTVLCCGKYSGHGMVGEWSCGDE